MTRKTEVEIKVGEDIGAEEPLPSDLQKIEKFEESQATGIKKWWGLFIKFIWRF